MQSSIKKSPTQNLNLPLNGGLAQSVLSTVAKSALSFYRVALSPHIGGGCRFHPSCSQYAVEAFDQHSFFAATKLVSIRLSKCHPFGSYGFDPVPKAEEVTK